MSKRITVKVRNLASSRSGQTLVEFTFVCLLLVTLLFAICQYGFLFAAYITVRNASAVGARQYAVLLKSAAESQKAAIGACYPMLQTNLVTATAGTATIITNNDAKSMTVSYAMPLVVPFVVPGGGATKTLTATTIMK